MTLLRRSLLFALTACITTGYAASSNREPHIGYVYPAGGRQASTFEATVGGQFLNKTKNAYVSGEGVRAEVVMYCRALRNLKKEQREDLQRRLKALKEKRLAELPNGDKLRRIRFPGERFVKRGARKGRKATKQDTMAKPVELPAHPLLRNLEGKSLRELYDVASAFFDFKSYKKKQPNAQIAEMVVIRVTIDPGATPGDRALRLRSPLGLTNPMCFQVATLPEVREAEPNDPKVLNPLPKEPAIDLPVVLNGQIMPGDVDRFRFRATRGQQLVIETHARRLVPFLADAVPGWFQATVALYDGKGREVAFADDYRFEPDPVLFYQIPEDGEYELEIRDSIYRGREDFVYRIAVGEQPFITRMFPLGGRIGVRAVAVIGGWNLPKKRLRLDTQPGHDPIRRTALRKKRRVSNEVVYAVGTLPECTETEPNNSAKHAQPIALPQTINGRIGRPGDVDVFRIEGRADDEVVVEVQARRLHSSLDSLVQLLDASGEVLEWNDDHVQKDGHLHRDMGFLTHHADSYLIAELPEDGIYYVRLADTQGHGGEAHGYRLRITPPQPDFTLHLTPSSLSMTGGRAALVTVHALRKDGFDGDIEIALRDAPPGFKLSGGRIPSGRDRVRMTLAAPTKPLDGPVALHVEGRARIGEQTISRPAVPSDDVMQAFLYRHLAPSRDLMVVVTRARWNALPVELASTDPVQIPLGGTVEVRFKTPRRLKLQKIKVQLNEPPEGLALKGVKALANGLTIEIEADGGATEAGLAGNLIVEAFIEYPVGKKGKKGGKAAKQRRRTSLGVLPAIPFEIVPQ